MGENKDCQYKMQLRNESNTVGMEKMVILIVKGFEYSHCGSHQKKNIHISAIETEGYRQR